MIILHASSLVGLLAVPVLALLSLWRWRRREAPVSSLLIWRRVAAEHASRSAHQRRHRVDPLLLLRVAIAVALTGAAAGVLFLSKDPPGRSVVLIVDHSASMAASWDACRAALDRALDSLDPADTVDILSLPGTGEPARALTPSAARRHLGTLEPSHRAAVPGALRRAAHLQPSHAAVIIVTDRPVEGLPEHASLLAVGSSDANRGIVAFAARRRPDGSYRVLAAVAGDEADTVLTLTVDGRDAERRPLSVRAGARAVAFFDAPADAVLLSARLEGADGLEADDQAWLARSAAPMRIALIGPSCPPLARALASWGDVELTEMAAPPGRAVPEGRDMAVYYRVVPTTLDGGLVALVAPRQPVGQLRPTAPAIPSAPPTAARDPLLEAVDLSEVKLGPLPHPTVFPSFETLVRAGNAVVIGRWRTGDTRILYVGADPALGNWALHPSFPIFWANVLTAASGERSDFSCARPGGAVRLFGSPADATVKAPTGERTQVAGGVFRPEKVGLYEVASDGEQKDAIAVSLLSESETVLSRYDHPLPADWIESAQGRTGPPGATNLTPWLLIAAAVLVLLHERLAAP
ncbi:BatA domain-containing protein [bacterium]|nr:BatA domain-containing protein [bacterium]